MTSKKRTSTHGNSLPVDLSSLSREELEQLFESLNTLDERTRYNKLAYVFPEEGPLRRELYRKHVSFMNASRDFHELLLVGANQSGKSFMLAYLAAMHITGRYPDWYVGKKLIGDVTIWCCSLTAAVTRDVLQTYLVGQMSDMGSGFIPKECIKDARPKHGVPNALDTMVIKREDGGSARVVFKSYDQGRRAYQGDRVDFILNDEEPEDPEIYSEQLTRTITTGGLVVTGFTPLRGLSKVVLRFLENGRFPVNHVPSHNSNIYVENITWEDAPHLGAAEKARLLKSYLPYEIEARSKGIPTVGSGKIYPIMESEFVVNSFKIPEHWPRAYGLDVGFGTTAAVWGALDIDTYGPDDPVVYVYNEYYSKREFPDVHANNILRNGSWIPGVIDPSANKDSQSRNSLMIQYRDLGLDVTNAKNSIEAGLLLCTNALTQHRCKVFNTCTNFLQEFSIYMFDDSGKVKRDQSDHAMDAWRYLMMSGLQRAITRPRGDDDGPFNNDFSGGSRSRRTGY